MVFAEWDTFLVRQRSKLDILQIRFYDAIEAFDIATSPLQILNEVPNCRKYADLLRECREWSREILPQWKKILEESDSQDTTQLGDEDRKILLQESVSIYP